MMKKPLTTETQRNTRIFFYVSVVNGFSLLFTLKGRVSSRSWFYDEKGDSSVGGGGILGAIHLGEGLRFRAGWRVL
jgi:hypothetical protein